MSSPLEWEVFVSPAVPVVTTDLPPGHSRRGWAPTSSTLIAGERDAVLVDTFITEEEAIALGDWVQASQATDARQLWERMSELHPTRMNPAALWNSCTAELRRRQ